MVFRGTITIEWNGWRQWFHHWSDNGMVRYHRPSLNPAVYEKGREKITKPSNSHKNLSKCGIGFSSWELQNCSSHQLPVRVLLSSGCWWNDHLPAGVIHGKCHNLSHSRQKDSNSDPTLFYPGPFHLQNFVFKFFITTINNTIAGRTLFNNSTRLELAS